MSSILCSKARRRIDWVNMISSLWILIKSIWLSRIRIMQLRSTCPPQSFRASVGIWMLYLNQVWVGIGTSHSLDPLARSCFPFALFFLAFLTRQPPIVVIEANKDGVKFSCQGDIGNGSVTIRQHKNVEKPDQNVTIDLSEPVALTFSLKYLVNFCKATSLSSTVRLCLSQDVPLLVEYGLGSGHLRFFLAPKVTRICTFSFSPFSFLLENYFVYSSINHPHLFFLIFLLVRLVFFHHGHFG